MTLPMTHCVLCGMMSWLAVGNLPLYCEPRHLLGTPTTALPTGINCYCLPRHDSVFIG